ncbi:hypothetical protein DY467_24060 [Rhodopseudomonas sp. BR0G17]|nr:hypothetical protein [Rhodopseudomonas sp. BR0G17]
MRGLDPPARPKPLRRGEGPRIHRARSAPLRRRWIAGSSPAMTAGVLSMILQASYANNVACSICTASPCARSPASITSA